MAIAPGAAQPLRRQRLISGSVSPSLWDRVGALDVALCEAARGLRP